MWLKLFFTGLLFFLIGMALAPITDDKMTEFPCPKPLRYTIALIWLGGALTIIVSILGFIWS